MPAPGTMVVFVDANVWYSRTLRDWVGRLYTLPETPPFEVRWTEDVMAEVLYSLRRKHPAWDGGRITRIRDLLQSTFDSRWDVSRASPWTSATRAKIHSTPMCTPQR